MSLRTEDKPQHTDRLYCSAFQFVKKRRRSPRPLQHLSSCFFSQSLCVEGLPDPDKPRLGSAFLPRPRSRSDPAPLCTLLNTANTHSAALRRHTYGQPATNGGTTCGDPPARGFARAVRDQKARSGRRRVPTGVRTRAEPVRLLAQRHRGAPARGLATPKRRRCCRLPVAATRTGRGAADTVRCPAAAVRRGIEAFDVAQRAVDFGIPHFPHTHVAAACG